MSTVKLTIDGNEVEVPKGTRVIEAAKKVNVDIPFYCYHPGLSVAGNCRMCLVEIEKVPKLQISCHMEVQEGMIVRTKTERVLQTRKHILEFLLLNHPVDCPVCDQAGECWLQDYYLRHGQHDSRLNENKIKKPKAVPVGPTVMLDAERCILCSRCVRFTDEISKTSELGIVNRGDHSEISVFPGTQLNNPYSGNVVDICPVGALTDKDFRFKMRVWYLESSPSICNGCSRGCNTFVQYKEGRKHHAKNERVMRLKPRFNADINEWWICDEGRYGYKYHDKDRILQPLSRVREQHVEQTWQQALTEIALKIKTVKHKMAVLVSPQLSNEELYLVKKLFKDELDISFLRLLSPKPEGFQDDLLIRADKNPNAKAAEILGMKYDENTLDDLISACEKKEVEGVLIFGQDLLSLAKEKPFKEILQKIYWSVFVGSNLNETSKITTYELPTATHIEKEGTFTNFEGKVQKFNPVLLPLGEAIPEWKLLLDLATALGIPFDYETVEEIFQDMTKELKEFQGLTYEALEPKEGTVREFAAPMVPELMQDSNLVFDQSKAKDIPS